MTSDSYYSQYGEDHELAKIFPVPGICVEVGAHDGVQHSNTYFFEQRGWQCILVEPQPNSCQKIKSVRKALLFECAVSDHNGRIDFHACDELPELSGFAPDLPRITREGGTTRAIHVPVRLLDDILAESGVTKVDFISIDVEGHEIAVLAGFSLERWRPRIVILEDSSEGTDDLLPGYMRKFHYVPWKMTGCNLWFSLRSDSELVSPLNLRQFGKARRLRQLRHFLPPFVASPLKAVYKVFRGK